MTMFDALRGQMETCIQAMYQTDPAMKISSAKDLAEKLLRAAPTLKPTAWDMQRFVDFVMVYAVEQGYLLPGGTVGPKLQASAAERGMVPAAAMSLGGMTAQKLDRIARRQLQSAGMMFGIDRVDDVDDVDDAAADPDPDQGDKLKSARLQQFLAALRELRKSDMRPFLYAELVAGNLLEKFPELKLPGQDAAAFVAELEPALAAFRKEEEEDGAAMSMTDNPISASRAEEIVDRLPGSRMLPPIGAKLSQGDDRYAQLADQMTGGRVAENGMRHRAPGPVEMLRRMTPAQKARYEEICAKMRKQCDTDDSAAIDTYLNFLEGAIDR